MPLCATSGAAAAAGSARFGAFVDALVTRTLHDEATPQASVAVVEDGRIVYARGFGGARADTRYGIGSVTKTIVAVLILRLAERNILSLGANVTRYLPWFVTESPISVRDLLAQTSGLRDYNDARFLVTVAPSVLPGHVDGRAIMTALARWPLRFIPGSHFDYSNANYFLLGLVAESAARKPLATLLRDEIFNAVGMPDTHLAAPDAQSASEAPAVTTTPFGPRVVAPWDPALTFTAGGVRSTVLDLARFDAALCSGRLLSAASAAAMRERATLSDGTRSSYGLGTFVDRDGAATMFWHDGTVLGYKAMNLVTPRRCRAVVVLANADYFQAPAIGRAIAAMAFGGSSAGPISPDQDLPGLRLLRAALLALAPVALALVLRRRLAVTTALAFASYFVGSAWLPGGATLACLAVLVEVWPLGREPRRAGQKTRVSPAE